jgi:hypothetical protein
MLIWFKRRKSEKSGIPSQVVRYTNDRLDRLDNDYIGLRDRSSDIPLIVPRAPTAIDPAVIAALTDCNKLLAKEWLTLGEIAGKGHFGTVYRARLYKPDTDETIDVAVKTMQNTSTCAVFFPDYAIFSSSFCCSVPSFPDPFSCPSDSCNRSSAEEACPSVVEGDASLRLTESSGVRQDLVS